jgi:hypothetical protein
MFFTYREFFWVGPISTLNARQPKVWHRDGSNFGRYPRT